MEEYVIDLSGPITDYYNSRDYIKYYLNKAGGKPIRLKVNSRGGSVDQALAISRVLEEQTNVTIEFVGFNASSATWMAFGAASIEIHEDAMWLAHKCSVPVEVYGMMNHDQLEQKIEELKNQQKSAESIDLMIASKYVDRCKKETKDVLQLMKESRWMSASEALEWGFVDKVIPGVNKKVNITNEITDEFTAMGLPVPTVPVDSENKQTGIVAQIIEGVRGIFNGSDKKEIDSIINKIKPIMRTEFISVNQVLNCQGLEENDGKVAIPIDQLKIINDAIYTANSDKIKAEGDLRIANESRTAAETKYNDAVAALDCLSDDVKNATDVPAKVAVIKNVLEKVPGVKVVAPAVQNDGKRDFSDVATDPINSYEED